MRINAHPSTWPLWQVAGTYTGADGRGAIAHAAIRARSEEHAIAQWKADRLGDGAVCFEGPIRARLSAEDAELARALHELDRDIEPEA